MRWLWEGPRWGVSPLQVSLPRAKGAGGCPSTSSNLPPEPNSTPPLRQAGGRQPVGRVGEAPEKRRAPSWEREETRAR